MSVELFDIPVSLLHRDDQDPELLKALIPYDQYNWAASLEPLEVVARTGNVLALFKYANTLGHLGEDEAAEHFWRIAISAGHTDSCNNLANLLKDQGRMDEVRPLYEIAAAAGAPDAIFNIGLLLQDENPEEAETWFLKAVDAGHGKACANLALKYFEEDRTEEAFRMAELGISRGDFYSATAIAVYHQRRSEWEEVIAASRRALTLADHTNIAYQGNAWDFIALGFIMLSRFEEAEKAIQDCRDHKTPQVAKLEDLIETARSEAAAEQKRSPKFCPNCGAPVGEGNAFCTGCGKQLQVGKASANTLPSTDANSNFNQQPALLTKNSTGLGIATTQAPQEIVVSQQITGSTFGDFDHYLSSCEELITPHLNGAISIDGGMLAIAGKALPSCETCYGYSSTSPQFDCTVCGRTAENYLHVRSGFGDGIYLNYDLFWGNLCGGTITVLDEGNEWARTVAGELAKVRSKEIKYDQTLAQFWDYFHAADKTLELHYFGHVQTETDERWSSQGTFYGSLFFGDTNEGIDSLASVVYSKNMPVSKHHVYGYCERDEKGVLIPRFVLTLREEVATKLGMPMSNPGLMKEFETWQNAGVFASIGGQLAQAATQINVAVEYAALANENFDAETIKDHETQLMSWFIIQYYQGSLNDSTLEHLKDLTPHMIQVYLRYRTCFGLAEKVTTWPPSTNKLGF
jgi:tetratricopeptide (TPR) repeat protein